MPRGTVSRILNSLEAGIIVIAAEGPRYRQGRTVLRLARAVNMDDELVGVGKPEMDRLASDLGFTVKLSVVEGERVVVVAISEGSRPYGVTTKMGRRFPLHAGAASKVLLAFADEATRGSGRGNALAVYTYSMICDAGVLPAEFDDIRRERVDFDRGEHMSGIRAVAAPIFDVDGRCVAALSAPFLDGEASDAAATIHSGIETAAATISAALGASPRGGRLS